jgi:hypothetical protein
VTEIEVRIQPQGQGWLCSVTITDDAGRSDHRVTVAPADLERFAPGASEPTDLVRRSFEFLLRREPRQSILHSFDLPVIERYFREYPEEIRSGR